MQNLLPGRKKPARLGVLAIVILMIAAAGVLPAAAEVAVIKVGFRDVIEMLPLVETLIAPGGKVSADQRTNSLVIVADAESIDRVRDFLKRMDKPVPQVVVRVRFDNESASRDRSVSAEARLRVSQCMSSFGSGILSWPLFLITRTQTLVPAGSR